MKSLQLDCAKQLPVILGLLGALTSSIALAGEDNDGIPDYADNCINVANPLQRDTDQDGYGNFCDADLNNDGKTNTLDLNIFKNSFGTSQTSRTFNPDADFDGNGHISFADLDILKKLYRNPPGPAPDTDEDGIPNFTDNCIEVANPNQVDTDNDGYGNFCDGDLNNDGLTNTLDLNLFKQSFNTKKGDSNYNPDADFDSSGSISFADLAIYRELHRNPPGIYPDTEGDRILDYTDNCIEVINPSQWDTDGDGFGNMCDGDLNNDGLTNTLDLNLFKQSFGAKKGDSNYNPDADFDSSGSVSFADLAIYRGLHRKEPGPSCCAL